MNSIQNSQITCYRYVTKFVLYNSVFTTKIGIMPPKLVEIKPTKLQTIVILERFD